MNRFGNSAFARFFTQFPRLMCAELLFAIPLAFFTGVFVLIGFLTGYGNIIIWCLGIIPSFALYPGLVMVVRKYAVEKENVSVVSTFKEGIKGNWKSFLFHGVITYLIITFSSFALLYYYSLAKTDITFGAVLTLYILFTLLLIVMMFYVPIMTVTYELKLRHIYKNSFLLIFGKILRNIAALFVISIPTLAAFLCVIASGGIWTVITIVLIILLYPLLYTYISISIISKGLQEAVGSFTTNNVTVRPSAEEEKQIASALEASPGDSDYVFVNGKMVKKKD